jgi:hypothetical protein
MIQETDERLRELERRWRQSDSSEDYANYVNVLSRTVPGLREAIQNYESTAADAQGFDTSDTNDTGYRRDELSDETLSSLNTWIEAGKHLDTLLQQYDIPYACEAGYNGCTKQGKFRQDPYNADVNNDPYSYEWTCDNCNYERAMDI